MSESAKFSIYCFSYSYKHSLDEMLDRGMLTYEPSRSWHVIEIKAQFGKSTFTVLTQAFTIIQR